jgi:hypothetical protein
MCQRAVYSPNLLNSAACQLCLQAYHAEQEIFSSKHEDSVPADSVLWTCAVLPMEQYVSYLNWVRQRSGKRSVAGPVLPDPFFEPQIHLAACMDLGKMNGNVGGSVKRKRKRLQEEDDGGASTKEAGGNGVLPLQRSVVQGLQ